MDLLGLPGYVSLVVFFVLLGVKLFAFINALLWSEEHYRAADKWSKAGWVTVTGVAVLLQVIALVPGIINVALTIASLVYLADVRPAMASLRRR
jgi:hypothetical protein